ncbi:MAG: hypothetical protein ABEI52_08380, partial [Halobacteriaceae archaeon]
KITGSTPGVSNSISKTVSDGILSASKVEDGMARPLVVIFSTGMDLGRKPNLKHQASFARIGRGQRRI